MQIVRDDVVAPRAVALRKGLGSCEDVSRSHRETEGSKRAAGQEGSDAALGAESMDDDEDSSEATPVGENIVLSPGNPPFTPELQGRPYVSLGGRKSGSRDRHRSSGGGKPVSRRVGRSGSRILLNGRETPVECRETMGQLRDPPAGCEIEMVS